MCAVSLCAQVVISSTIVGTVTDPQGAVIPDASVTITNVDTGILWNTTTSQEGEYQVPNLNAGHYKIQVTKEGFASAISTVVALENGTTVRLNVALRVGRSSETVSVAAAATLMKTDDANVSDVIDTKTIANLPTQGRNYLNVAQISAGI